MPRAAGAEAGPPEVHDGAPAPSTARVTLAHVLERPLVLIGGKGGVGKTTLAAALGLAVASRHPAHRVLLLSTDPAHSLVDALGGDAARASLPANIRVLELDAVPVFDEFRARHREGLRLIGLRGTFLDDEDLRGFLDLGLPGLDEVSALKVIGDAVQSGEAEHVIVDTAPTGHTLRLLELPALLGRWEEALESLMAKHRLMVRVYAGRYCPDAADALIGEVGEILGSFRAVLGDADRCAFVPVVNGDPLSFWETERLLRSLDRLGIAVPCLLANKVLDYGETCGLCNRRQRDQAAWLHRVRERFAGTIVDVPWLAQEPRGTNELRRLGSSLLFDTPLAPAVLPPSQGVEILDPGPITAVRHEAGRAIERASLFLVCGKGGVGKTTVASALALRLAARPGARVLLFSTDPAHSLSDAFGMPIGEEPTRILDGLDAIEIDPEERLRAIQDTFREEVRAFFASLFRSDLLDSTLDREAMEHLIDLAPPGLDEIMALSELTRYMRARTYERFVVDTAPTGHFLRFLELPEIIRAWLRSFFEVLLKYRKVLRVPKVQGCLVELSKSVRDLQAALRNKETSLLVPVALPTELSLRRTRDLLDRTGQMGLLARFGVLNRMTLAARECATCASNTRASRDFLRRFRDAFPTLPLLCLEEQEEEPLGIHPLARVGTGLFG